MINMWIYFYLNKWGENCIERIYLIVKLLKDMGWCIKFSFLVNLVWGLELRGKGILV